MYFRKSTLKFGEIKHQNVYLMEKNFLENGWFVNYYLIIFLNQWPAIILWNFAKLIIFANNNHVLRLFLQ